VRGTLKEIEVERWGGEQAHRRVGSLKPLQDLHIARRALWTRLRSGFFLIPFNSSPASPIPSPVQKGSYSLILDTYGGIWREIFRH
jgi:hypothetical protein